jgi:hypothetical protein
MRETGFCIKGSYETHVGIVYQLRRNLRAHSVDRYGTYSGKRNSISGSFKLGLGVFLPGLRKYCRAKPPLHRFRTLNPQPIQHLNQFAQGDGCRRQQKGLPRGIFFGKNVVFMVEVVELLRQLEGVFGQISGL